MKVLLFTHSQDIDGIGCAILASKSFKDCKIEPTKTFDITNNVGKYIDSKEIYKYDKIYVTDLCIKEPLLKFIDNDKELKDKLLVLDHHKTEIEEGNNKYDFVNIIIENDMGVKESGTSLFYKYLLDNNYLEESKILNEIVEWTRQYDVWDWQKENNYNAKKLHILFETLGYKKYLELINYKVENLDKIEFNDFETSIINKFEKNVLKEISEIVEKIKVITLNINDFDYRIGYVKSPYKYRNDINEFIIKEGNKQNIDIIGMIMTDIDTVSYRQVKNYDVSIIAKHFGGKGHVGASSNSQDNKLFKKMIEENKIEFI